MPLNDYPRFLVPRLIDTEGKSMLRDTNDLRVSHIRSLSPSASSFLSYREIRSFSSQGKRPPRQVAHLARLTMHIVEPNVSPYTEVLVN